MKFEFEATGDPRKHGQPYVAKLVLNSEGKISREFFNLDKSYGKRTVTVFGNYDVADGEIIERRDSDGSWKNDDRVIKLCVGTKLYTVADPDRSSDMPAVSRYLKTGVVPDAWRKTISEAINDRLAKGRECMVHVIRVGGANTNFFLMRYKGEPTPYPEVIA